MFKTVLLGDSIRQIGYGSRVAENLRGKAEVWQPADNCRYAQHTLRGLFDWSNALEGADIVHWNNGLWDSCDLFGDGTFTDVDVYVKTMVRIAKVLRTKGVGKIIFATTTPVREENVYNRNEDIRRFNREVVPALTALGAEINDLYTPLSTDIPRYIRADDRIHLTEEGIALCADAVTAAILRAADTL